MVDADVQPRAERSVAPSPALEAAEWFAVACELDAENRQLRSWLTNMLLQVAFRDELIEFGLKEIECRWPPHGTEGTG